MAIVRWDPARELDVLQTDMNRIFDAFFQGRGSRAVFGDRLSLHQLRFALAETIAHLIWLIGDGKLRESVRDGIVIYEQVH